MSGPDLFLIGLALGVVIGGMLSVLVILSGRSR
jgi:hypothetical protein